MMSPRTVSVAGGSRPCSAQVLFHRTSIRSAPLRESRGEVDPSAPEPSLPSSPDPNSSLLTPAGRRGPSTSASSPSCSPWTSPDSGATRANSRTSIHRGGVDLRP
jgi:hypothetical protein